MAHSVEVPHHPRVLPPWPSLGEEEIQSAVQVLRSGKINYWTGEEGKLFEKEFSEYVGCRYGVALANGSVALELALIALNIGKGDEVVVTCRSFIASASSIVLVGATPVFADVDPESQNITAATIRAVLTPKTRGIIAVHLAGWPCEMDEIMELAKEHNLWVIEDCAQAHGATYKGRPAGGLGHVAAWSFCQDKIITTGGEGGMLTTNSREIWERAWSYKDHGKSYDAVFHRVHPPGFRWLHESFGTNWRMTEMQAAIGRVALKKLPSWVELRRRNAAILRERLSSLEALRIPIPPSHIGHSYYRFYVFVRPERLKRDWNRDRIMVELNRRGVPCNVGSCSEIYKEKAFQSFLVQKPLTVAQELGRTSLAFPVHPTLEPEDMHWIADQVEEVIRQAMI